jgi:hypothetical protein
MTKAPECIDPIDITIMDDEEFERRLDVIRAARLRAFVLFMEAEKDKQDIRDGKLREKLAHQLKMLNKELPRGDKIVDALEKRMNNIRSIQLELGQLDD